MPPERSDLVLATHVPHGETDIFKFYRLHIKTFTEEAERGQLLTLLNTGENHQRTTTELQVVKGKKIKESLSPMVGMVVTISPSFSLYKMVVFPAASNPTAGKQHGLKKQVNIHIKSEYKSVLNIELIA